MRPSETSDVPAGARQAGARRGTGPGARLGLVLLAAGIMVLAVNLRAAISSLPPVFPELQARLHLSSAQITVLAIEGW